MARGGTGARPVRGRPRVGPALARHWPPVRSISRSSSGRNARIPFPSAAARP